MSDDELTIWNDAHLLQQFALGRDSFADVSKFEAIEAEVHRRGLKARVLPEDSDAPAWTNFILTSTRELPASELAFIVSCLMLALGFLAVAYLVFDGTEGTRRYGVVGFVVVLAGWTAYLPMLVHRGNKIAAAVGVLLIGGLTVLGAMRLLSITKEGSVLWAIVFTPIYGTALLFPLNKLLTQLPRPKPPEGIEG